MIVLKAIMVEKNQEAILAKEEVEILMIIRNQETILANVETVKTMMAILVSVEAVANQTLTTISVAKTVMTTQETLLNPILAVVEVCNLSQI